METIITCVTIRFLVFWFLLKFHFIVFCPIKYFLILQFLLTYITVPDFRRSGISLNFPDRLGILIKPKVDSHLGGKWAINCTNNTMRCRYNAVNFLKNIFKRRLIARPLGNNLCNILPYLTAFQRRLDCICICIYMHYFTYIVFRFSLFKEHLCEANTLYLHIP